MNDGGKIQKDPGLDRDVNEHHELKQKIHNMLFQRIMKDVPMLVNEK